LARENPSLAELHGFDVSLDQVCPKPWLPASMHMHTWDIFKEPPQEFVGYFDVVHVRLITVVIKNNDPRPVLANLTKLLSRLITRWLPYAMYLNVSNVVLFFAISLEPGGYLQWDEVDTIGCSIQTVPGVSAENLEKLFSQLRGRDT
jgi:hypothetical protein